MRNRIIARIQELMSEVDGFDHLTLPAMSNEELLDVLIEMNICYYLDHNEMFEME